MKYDCFENGWDDVGDTDGEEFLQNPYPPLERVPDRQLENSPSTDHGGPPSSQMAAIKAAGAAGKKTVSPFIKGPLCREWIVRASLLRKPALKVGLALYFKAGVLRNDFIRRKQAESRPIRCDRSLKTAFKISSSQLSRGLQALQEAGLILILKGGPGRCPVVVIINTQIERHGLNDKRRDSGF